MQVGVPLVAIRLFAARIHVSGGTQQDLHMLRISCTLCRHNNCVILQTSSGLNWSLWILLMDRKGLSNPTGIADRKRVLNRSFMTPWVSIQMLVDCALCLKWPLKYDWYYALTTYHASWWNLHDFFHHPQPLSCQSKTCVGRLSLGMSHWVRWSKPSTHDTIATAPRNSPDMHRPWTFPNLNAFPWHVFELKQAAER